MFDAVSISSEQITLGTLLMLINGVVTLAIMRYELRGVKDENNQLKKENGEFSRENKEMRDTHIAGLHRRIESVEKFNAGCPATEIKANLDNLVGWTKKNDLVTSDVRDKVNQLLAKEESTKIWIGNLDSSHQAHVRDHSIHGVHHNG